VRSSDVWVGSSYCGCCIQVSARVSLLELLSCASCCCAQHRHAHDMASSLMCLRPSILVAVLSSANLYCPTEAARVDLVCMLMRQLHLHGVACVADASRAAAICDTLGPLLDTACRLEHLPAAGLQALTSADAARLMPSIVNCSLAAAMSMTRLRSSSSRNFRFSAAVSFTVRCASRLLALCACVRARARVCVCVYVACVRVYVCVHAALGVLAGARHACVPLFNGFVLGGRVHCDDMDFQPGHLRYASLELRSAQDLHICWQ
jgi:hypothetical protein